MAIALFAVVVFLIDGYGYLRQAWAWMFAILALAVAVSLPLQTELRQLKADDAAQRVVETYLHEHYPHRLQNGQAPMYGADDLIPRR